MNPTLLVTGASGMIGRDLVPYLLAHSGADLVLLLHRQGAGLDVPVFLRRQYGLPPSPRVRVVWGDVTRPDLGLSRSERSGITRSVTHVLHAAACTRFDLPLAEAAAVNTEGTRRLAALAASCGRLEAFGYVSTAYVSGRRTGVIREDELDHDAGFVNTYERSKYEAELLLRGLRGILPVSVYRLSTVFGDSRTGSVGTMTAPHHAMRVMHMGLASLLPGRPDYRVDLIPGDYAAATVGRLFLGAFRPGETFHITSAPGKACTLAELIDLVYTLFAGHDPAWGKRRYPRPVLSSPEAFELFAVSIERSGNPFLAGVLRTVRSFAHQLTHPKAFDRTNVCRALPAYDEDQPDVRHYLAKVVRYCLQTQWGKHAA